MDKVATRKFSLLMSPSKRPVDHRRICTLCMLAHDLPISNIFTFPQSAREAAKLAEDQMSSSAGHKLSQLVTLAAIWHIGCQEQADTATMS